MIEKLSQDALFERTACFRLSVFIRADRLHHSAPALLLFLGWHPFGCRKPSAALRLTIQRAGQPLNRLINLGVALKSDHHCVHEAAFDGMLDGLLAVFGLGEIAVAAEIHGDDVAIVCMISFYY